MIKKKTSTWNIILHAFIHTITHKNLIDILEMYIMLLLYFQDTQTHIHTQQKYIYFIISNLGLISLTLPLHPIRNGVAMTQYIYIMQSNRLKIIFKMFWCCLVFALVYQIYPTGTKRKRWRALYSSNACPCLALRICHAQENGWGSSHRR